MKRRRILFITRNFPPVRGGMERYCFELYQNLSQLEEVELCANRKGKSNLPFYLMRALFVLLWRGRRFTHIHFGDAALTPLLVLAKIFFSARLSVTTYGLDVVYPNRFYQTLIPRCLRYAHTIICISQATREECLRRGVPTERCFLVPAGIDFSTVIEPLLSLRDLEEKYSFRVNDRPLLFSIARLVRRKGHAWFITEVLPRLPGSTHYVIAGSGPETEAIRLAIAQQGLEKRVSLLGSVSDEEKACLFKQADIFIMPNFHVEGDLEGFGLTLTEAAAYGLPAIAARVDGIPTAVIDGVTGFLVPEGDPQAFVEMVPRCARLSRQEVQKQAEDVYSWQKIAQRYVEILTRSASAESTPISSDQAKETDP